MFELQNITFTADDGGVRNEILKNVSCRFDAGKFFAITGPNGSGKSTLAQIIAGIKQPTSGKLLFDGDDITGKSLTWRAKKGIAFAFQQPVKIKGISVYELLDIALGGGADPKEIKKHLGMVGLEPEDYLGRELSSGLSGGELKRIEIASVLARKARISIFDEPEAGIDMWSFDNLIDTLKKLRKDNPDGIIIIISHQKKILEMADEVMLLKRGSIVDSGLSDEMLKGVGGNGRV